MKKNEKPSFRYYFYRKWDEIGREGGKKIFVPNSVHTRAGVENSEKNIAKKFKKLKNLISALFFAETG